MDQYFCTHVYRCSEYVHNFLRRNYVNYVSLRKVRIERHDNKNEAKKEPPEFKGDVKNSRNSDVFKFDASKNKLFFFENSGLY